MPYVRGEAKEWPRKEFFYWTDDSQFGGDALRPIQGRLPEANRPKVLAVWREPLVPFVLPNSTRCEPTRSSGQFHEAGGIRRVVCRPHVGGRPGNPDLREDISRRFKDFPPRQGAPGSFNISSALDKMQQRAEQTLISGLLPSGDDLGAATRARCAGSHRRRCSRLVRSAQRRLRWCDAAMVCIVPGNRLESH